MRFQLRLELCVLDDRAGDHFREKADIKAEIQRIFLRGRATVVNVRKIRQVLEGEEGNAERKRRRRRVQRERQNGVERFDGKCGVFVKAEKQQIEQHADHKKEFCAAPPQFCAIADVQADAIVENRYQQQKQQIDRRTPCIKTKLIRTRSAFLQTRGQTRYRIRLTGRNAKTKKSVLRFTTVPP